MPSAATVVATMPSTRRREYLFNARLPFAFRAISCMVRTLDRNLPPDLNDLIVGQAEEVADMDGVALHDGEDPLLPGRQALTVVTGDHRLVTYIVGNVGNVDRAAEPFAGGQQVGNVRTFHEAETRFGAPEIRHDFPKRDAVGGRDPGHGEYFNVQHEQVLVQGTVMLDVPDHYRRRIPLGPGQEHRRARHPRYVLRGDRGHKFGDRGQRLVDPHRDGGSTAMPDPHQAIDTDGQDHRNIAALADLGEIGEEERAIDRQEKDCNCAGGPYGPTPDLAHRDEQKDRC